MGAPVSLVDVRLQPQADVVELLEEWLAMAKSGELRSVVCVGESSGLATSTAHAMGDGDVSHLICAIERVKLRMLLQ